MRELNSTCRQTGVRRKALRRAPNARPKRRRHKITFGASCTVDAIRLAYRSSQTDLRSASDYFQ